MKRILFLTVVAFILTACGTSSEVKNTTATTNVAPANTLETNRAPEPVKEETFTGGVNPRADLISATQKLQKLTFWSARISSETTPEANAEMQFAAPDRYRIKKTDGEVIVIGSDSFSNENGKWEKIEDDIGEFIREQIQTGIEEGVKNLQGVQITGKEQVNGKDATVYMHKFGDITTKVWIGTESGLQLKNEVEANVGGKFKKQTTVYDYEKKVSIQAPKIN